MTEDINCKRCNRLLKSEHSKELGYGSSCYKKAGLIPEKKEVKKQQVKGYF